MDVVAPSPPMPVTDSKTGLTIMFDFGPMFDFGVKSDGDTEFGGDVESDDGMESDGDVKSDDEMESGDETGSEGDIKQEGESPSRWSGSPSSSSSARSQARGSSPADDAATGNGCSFWDFKRCLRCHQNVPEKLMAGHMKAHRLEAADSSSIQEVSGRCYSCISAEAPCVVARRPNTPGLMTIRCVRCLRAGTKCSFETEFSALAVKERNYHPACIQAAIQRLS